MNNNIAMIAEAARLEFRRFGFRADGGAMISKSNFSFEPEAGTGQMAFLVDRIRPGIDLFGVVGEGEGVDLSGRYIRLEVTYSHPQSSGSNGFGLDYVLVAKTGFGAKEYRLAMVDRDVLRAHEEARAAKAQGEAR